jgi:predicted PhzF superfamily epimerase YddE/YHI9
LEQGIEIGRPSSLRIRVRRVDEQPVVEVGGEVVPIASGRFMAV